MHPRPEARIHSGSQRHDAVLAVLFANLIHRGERPAPVFSSGLIDQTGLPFVRLERLRVDSKQPDGSTGPVFMKEFARRCGQLGIDLGRMIEGIDAAVVRAAEATQISPVACITVHAALREPLRFRSGMPVQAVMNELLPTSYGQLRRSFDDLRYGALSQYPLIGFGSLTTFDPSRVPEGRATLHAWDYVPYERPDGRSWDETKRDYAERMIDHMGRFIENIDHANILQYHCDSPVDMERTSPSFRRGDLHGIAMTTYQSGAHRPTPELGQYTVPGVERLYLVGPFQHPGGGVFGAGRATAIRLAEDLKMDLARIPRRALRRAAEFAMSRALRLVSRL